ncbi:hypothetical protein SE92_33615 [Bradyrhizobium sp. AT1]|nr:hypothetical protein SE92_33615 [Bradyrhizobium sp. AT1]
MMARERTNMLPESHDDRKMQAKRTGARRAWMPVHCSAFLRHEIMAWAPGLGTRPGCMFAMISLLI